MRIRLTSVYVHDQQAALRFCTEVLGFEKKIEIPTGERSWLTVASPEDSDGPQLVLEPGSHPAMKPFKDALMDDGPKAHIQSANRGQASRVSTTSGGVSPSEVAERVNRPR